MSGRYKLHALFVVVTCIIGCGRTIGDRKAISDRAKELADIVRSNPHSNESQASLSKLIGILNGNWRFARCQAAYALGDLGDLASPAVPELMRAATCGDDFVEEASVDALSKIGPGAAPAVDLLIEKVELAMSSGSEGLESWHAVVALGNIGKPALKSVPVLERALKSTDRTLARHAQESLKKLGS
jgi:HEAT repeat protein